MSTYATVLGAGGIAGGAFHCGVLAALETEVGLDVRRSDLLVGTSIGASVSASLRAGISGVDLYARMTGGAVSAEAHAIASHVVTPLQLPPPRLTAERPLSIALAARGLARRRPVIALAGALPPGLLDPAIVAQRIRELHGPTWPEPATWVCAVRVDTGRRAVFGRDDLPVDELGSAVGASVAVPGYFAPMTVGGIDFVDGGTHSVTNADLVARAGFDAVVVSAPMTSAGTRWTRGRIGRSWHTRTLDAELAEVPAEVAMLVARPTTAIIERIGSDTMSQELEPDVAEMAFEMMARDLAGGRYDPALERLEVSRSAASEAGTE